MRASARAMTVTAATSVALVLLAAPASAHVTVHPSSLPKGATDTELTFQVPNEEDVASTTELQIYFPTDYPLASVLVRPVPGWSSQVQTENLARPIQTDDGPVTDAVTEITWQGGQIAPGQYQDFSISVGVLPSNTNQLVFKALQTYSNGDVVRWIEVPGPSEPNPEHPGAVLTLTSPTGAKASEA